MNFNFNQSIVDELLKKLIKKIGKQTQKLPEIRFENSNIDAKLTELQY